MPIVQSQRVLTGRPSIFLDAIRFMAAVTVLVTHARAVWFPENELDTLPSNLSHGAVVLFFVLSGFVIAHTTTHNNRGPVEYAVARLSRLYSIFFPSIVITLICLLLIKIINPLVYANFHQDKTVFRYLISIFFCNEVWFLSSAPVINGPIWSLSYEFWYYTIFGAFFYKIKGAKGFIIPLLVCMIAGPKVLLLMLMWLAGWFVYHLPRPAISDKAAWSSMVGLLALSVCLMIYLPSWPHPVNTTKLHWADKFVSDWLVSLVVSTAFYFLPAGKKNEAISPTVKSFRKLADMTFPIYVLHFPLLVLCKSFLNNEGGSQLILFWISLGIVFFSCVIIGFFLESNRKFWSTLFKSLFRVNLIKNPA